jgi:hypothetical protein
MNTRPSMLHALRKTLQSVIEAEKRTPNDPVLLEQKRSLLRAIAELEMRRTSESKTGGA